jgi:hypothetical protein
MGTLMMGGESSNEVVRMMLMTNLDADYRTLFGWLTNTYGFEASKSFQD